MAIDYQKVLENPEVLAWAKAACPDYQVNVDSDGEEYAKEQLEDWLRDNLLDRGENCGRLGESPAPPLVAAGQRANLRVNNRYRPLAQQLNVGLRRSVLPHLMVHRRGDN